MLSESEQSPSHTSSAVAFQPQDQMAGNEQWFSRYSFCRPLGQGGMGTVYLAEDKQSQNRSCVIKQLSAKFTNPKEQAEAVRLFKREAEILGKLDHPGIVRIFDAHVTSDNRYFLVMDYVPGTNLDTLLRTGGPVSYDLAVALAIQCCEVLEYLHTQDPPIIYRDLKPSNIMLTPDAQVVLIDFGIARFLMRREAATKVVSAGYSPPEQYAGKPEPASDFYALGCTLSHLLTGVHPKPLTVSSPAQFDSRIPPELDTLCRKLTAKDIKDRPPDSRAVRLALYKIYLKANPETEIPEDLLKEDRTPLRKPGTAGDKWLHGVQSEGSGKGIGQAAQAVIRTKQYFKQILENLYTSTDGTNKH
jgi:serine/threonine-protein kinase